jgi:hypothetical protein
VQIDLGADYSKAEAVGRSSKKGTGWQASWRLPTAVV